MCPEKESSPWAQGRAQAFVVSDLQQITTCLFFWAHSSVIFLNLRKKNNYSVNLGSCQWEVVSSTCPAPARIWASAQRIHISFQTFWGMNQHYRCFGSLGCVCVQLMAMRPLVCCALGSWLRELGTIIQVARSWCSVLSVFSKCVLFLSHRVRVCLERGWEDETVKSTPWMFGKWTEIPAYPLMYSSHLDMLRRLNRRKGKIWSRRVKHNPLSARKPCCMNCFFCSGKTVRLWEAILPNSSFVASM